MRLEVMNFREIRRKVMYDSTETACWRATSASCLRPSTRSDQKNATGCIK